MTSSGAGVVLVIAGVDPSGGAGLIADVATVGARGLRAAGVATALTVQDSAGCYESVAVEPALVGRQLARVVADLPIAAVKIGMLATAATARVVAEALAPLARRGVKVVLDPVLRATVGAALLDGDPVAGLAPLVELAALVTPNRDEAARLTGLAVDDERGQRAAASALRRAGAAAVLCKGGHLPGAEVVDLLDDGGEPLALRSTRIPGEPPHGTGCALATEITCLLAVGAPLRKAVVVAHERVAARVAGALQIGRGRRFLSLSQ